MRVEGVIFDYGRTLYDPVTSSLFPDAIPTLEALQARNLQLGMVTLAPTDETEQRVAELAEHGILQYFQAIDVITRSTRRKSFERVLQDLGLSPKETVVVGDNVRQEIFEGNKIGAYTVWLTKRAVFQPRESFPLEHAQTIIEEVGEMVGVVDRLSLA